jgi:hypothetical protein
MKNTLIALMLLSIGSIASAQPATTGADSKPAATRGEARSGSAAQSPSAVDADGKPKVAPVATRQQTQACKNEADEKKLTGTERRKFTAKCARDAAAGK